MEAFGLLHLEEKAHSAVNMGVDNFEQQINIYFSNAVTLSKTLKAKNIKFTLLTNNLELLLKLLDKQNSKKINDLIKVK